MTEGVPSTEFDPGELPLRFIPGRLYDFLRNLICIFEKSENFPKGDDKEEHQRYI